LERQSDRLVCSDDFDFDKMTVEEIKTKAAVLTAEDFGIDQQKGPQLGNLEKQREVEAEVDALVGMDNVKEFFTRMKTKVQYIERGGDMSTLRTSLNMVLTGNPGTGKTTVARLMAKFLHAFGILPTDRFVEKNALSLKGQYVGQTGPTVKQAVADAMGGCLFIDEAYALVDRGGDAFSGEAIRMLLTEVENNRTNLLVILAGYEDKMGVLMDADPGLHRRFGNRLHLQDYNPLQIAQICETVARDRFNFDFPTTPAANGKTILAEVSMHIQKKHAHEIHNHNGGLAVTLTEQAVGRLAQRVVQQDIHGAGACVLLAEDYGISPDVEDDVEEVEDTPTSPPPSVIGQEAATFNLSQHTPVREQVEEQQPLEAPTLEAWLQERRILQYASALEELGVKSLLDLPDVEENDLKEMGFSKLEQRRWFRQKTTATATAFPLLQSMSISPTSVVDRWGKDLLAKAQVQEPPSVIRTRTRRAPPKAATAVPVKAFRKPKPVEEEVPVEDEDEEEPEQTEAQMLAALKVIGVCPQSFKWSKRSSMSEPCMKCDGAKSKRCKGAGYQCEGGSHWVCSGCLLPAGPSKPVARFE
jgi:hypothetical protein